MSTAQVLSFWNLSEDDDRVTGYARSRWQIMLTGVTIYLFHVIPIPVTLREGVDPNPGLFRTIRL